MKVNLKNYKHILFYNLLFDKEELSTNRLVLAQVISASGPDYLGHSPDMENETEKEIYQYARQLMNDVLVKKTEFNRLLEQMASELGIDKNIIKNEINLTHPLIKTLINDDYRQFQQLVKNCNLKYKHNIEVEVHGWMNNIDIFNECLKRVNSGSSSSQMEYAQNITSFMVDYLNSQTKLSSEEQEKIYHIGQQLVQDLLIYEYSSELVLNYAGYNITPLTRTIIAGNYEEFQKELVLRAKRGLDFSDGYNKPLEWAILAQPNDMRYLQGLIKMGADVNDSSYYQTPLTIACSEDNIEAVKLLVEAGADVNKKGLFFELPLILTKKPEIVDFLIKSGADVNKMSNLCNTALVIACERGRDIKIIQQLINAGADINVKDYTRLTSLDWALVSGKIETIELLFKSGAKSTPYFEKRLEENKEKWGSHYDKIKEWIAESNKKDMPSNEVNLIFQTQQKVKKNFQADNKRKGFFRNLFFGGRG